MNSGASWESLSPSEQETKLKQVGALLKENGLEHIQPKVLDQIIYRITASAVQHQKVLTIEGSVTGDKADLVKKFKAQAKTGPLAGLNPQTTSIEIEVKLAVGAPYKTIEEVADINTLEEKTIVHKAG